VTDPYPSPGFQPPPLTGYQPQAAPPLGLQSPVGPPSAGQPSSGGSGKGAKTLAIVLGVLLVLVAAGAGLLISSSKGDADDAKAELANVRESLDSLESDSGSVEDQIDELLNQQAADEQAKTDLQDVINGLNEQVDALNAQLESGGDAAAVQAQLDETTAQLDESEAALADTQAELDAANAALADAQAQPAGGSFSVEPAVIRPTLGDFSVVTNKIDCVGFADPVAACPDTFTLNGRFVVDGTQMFMEFANVAKVPIASFDGFNYAGSTPATSDVSSLCEGQVLPATMSVQIAPVRYDVDASTQIITATAFSFTWTIFSEESGICIGSTQTYTGTLVL